MSLLPQITPGHIPKHIAIIMDGNGRWAEGHGQVRTFGHWSGVDSVRDTIEGAVEAGVEVLTLYAFSTENWVRPAEEIETLMEILVSSIHNELPSLMKNNIRLNAFGQISSLPQRCQIELADALSKTAGNLKLTVNLALSYGSRWEIIDAVRRISEDWVAGRLDLKQIDEPLFEDYLCTAGMPDPELLIRTSGEQRVSNFLLWQIAYTELYFTKKNWPDFRREDLFEAILDYQTRERRFGATGKPLPQPAPPL